MIEKDRRAFTLVLILDAIEILSSLASTAGNCVHTLFFLKDFCATEDEFGRLLNCEPSTFFCISIFQVVMEIFFQRFV